MKTETAKSKNTTAKLLKVKPKLAIEYRAISTLRLDPNNPRLHSKKQIRQLTKSIEVFGFLVPVLVDGRGQVIAGHGRVLAARRLGMTDVPTIKVAHLTDAQLLAFMIADNRLTETSIWDERLLGEQFKALSVLELDFAVDVTGFEMGEINLMIEGLAPASCGKQDPADSIPEFGTTLHVTQAGDLWGLDRHWVYCGDARNDTAYSVLTQDRRAATVFSDPLCSHPIDDYLAGLEKIHHAEFPEASGKMREEEFTTFLIEVLKLVARHSADGALQFICMDWSHTPELLAAARHAYTEFKDLCIWIKDAAGQSSLYRSQHELVFVFKSGEGAHRNNIRLSKSGRYRTNVWKYRPVKSMARDTNESNLSDLRPTIKPVELVADAIVDSTARGDIVLDPFLGSGTTLIAAERTGRVCCGIELDPRYVDTIVRRWQKYTGLEAVHQRTGQTFAQREKETPDAQQG